MKTIILAGGTGTRISEESHLRPKPMVEIGGKPILWHIMKGYTHYGFNDFDSLSSGEKLSSEIVDYNYSHNFSKIFNNTIDLPTIHLINPKFY